VRTQSSLIGSTAERTFKARHSGNLSCTVCINDIENESIDEAAVMPPDAGRGRLKTEFPHDLRRRSFDRRSADDRRHRDHGRAGASDPLTQTRQR
jgi:hypothetical protein